MPQTYPKRVEFLAKTLDAGRVNGSRGNIAMQGVTKDKALADAFRGGQFGAVVDRFGIQ